VPCPLRVTSVRFELDAGARFSPRVGGWRGTHGPDLRAQDTFALGLYVLPLSLRVYALTAHKSFRTFTADLSWHVVLWVPVEPIRCIHPVPSRTAPPSPFIDRLGTSNGHFGAYGFAIATTCQVASPPSRWTFTFELSDRSVTLPAVEYNYGANWTIYPGGTSTH
jgi:hypothetical protein